MEREKERERERERPSMNISCWKTSYHNNSVHCPVVTFSPIRRRGGRERKKERKREREREMEDEQKGRRTQD